MIDKKEFEIPDEVPELPLDQRQESSFVDIDFERGLPASLDAERTILGAILLDNSAHREAAAALTFEDFALTAHQRVFARMDALLENGQPVDIVTLAEELSRRKEIESVGGVAWLASLTEGLPRRLSIAEYVKLVAEKALLRKLITVCSSAITRAADQSETAWETLEAVERQFVEVRDKGRLLSLRRASEPFFVGFRTFLSTAPQDVDWTVEGLIQSDGNGLILGDPGTSKSLAVFDLALHLAAGVAWFGHNIPKRTKVGLVTREDAPGLSQSRLKRLRDGGSEAMQVWLSGVDLEDWIHVNTRAQRETWTLQKEADIQEVIESIKERGIQFVFFDVFRVLWAGNENRSEETAAVLESVKRIGREARCQIGLVHHVSKSDRGTIFDRARGSGILGWREWAIGITIENPDSDPDQHIRKMEFQTKASRAANPLFYRINGDDKEPINLEQVETPAPQYNYAAERAKKKDKPRQGAMYGDS